MRVKLLPGLSMKWLKYFFYISFILFAPYQSVAEEINRIGWIENVRVFPGELQFKAKIDTGAYNSSINAKNIIEFEKEGEAWVRFDIVNRNKVSTTIELPLIKEVSIKRHFGKTQRRYAVMLGVCLGKTYKKTQVSLVDRQGFLYAMLIGRSFLKGDFMIDPARQFTVSPRCPMADPENE